MNKRIGLGLYQSWGNMGSVERVVGVGGVGGVILDYLCGWQVRVSMYYARRGYLRILGAPSVKSSYILSIAASYRVI